MRPILTPSEMQALERRYMDGEAVASLSLMERAARRIFDHIISMLHSAAGKRALFACGPGGNGGDGYAAARLLAEAGGEALIVSTSTPSSADAVTNYNAAMSTPGCRFLGLDELPALGGIELCVDAMFGTGLGRPLGGAALELARFMNRGGAPVLAVDIPSGLSGYSGANLGECVMADETITFEHPKAGHVLGDGLDAVGRLTVAPIGIPDSYLTGDEARLVEPCDAAIAAAPRARNTHKGSYGSLLIVAGSVGMGGAAGMAANAALRAGAGLVTVACPEEVLQVVQLLAPCATALPLPCERGAISGGAAPIIEAALAGRTACCIGPGLSLMAAPEVLECALRSGLPILVDADALNILAERPELMGLLKPHHLLTPHPGEARRLLRRDMESPIGDARALSGLGCTALLKGAATVISGEHITISTSGSPGMAKGGSGDALTGIIGAMLARGFGVEEAAYIGSELHGAAGELAAARAGEISMTALDLIDMIGEALKRVG